jgi:hypothetical protein
MGLMEVGTGSAMPAGIALLGIGPPPGAACAQSGETCREEEVKGRNSPRKSLSLYDLISKVTCGGNFPAHAARADRVWRGDLAPLLLARSLTISSGNRCGHRPV